MRRSGWVAWEHFGRPARSQTSANILVANRVGRATRATYQHPPFMKHPFTAVLHHGQRSDGRRTRHRHGAVHRCRQPPLGVVGRLHGRRPGHGGPGEARPRIGELRRRRLAGAALVDDARQSEAGPRTALRLRHARRHARSGDRDDERRPRLPPRCCAGSTRRQARRWSAYRSTRTACAATSIIRLRAGPGPASSC